MSAALWRADKNNGSMATCVTDALEERKCIGLKQNTLLARTNIRGLQGLFVALSLFSKKVPIGRGQVYRHTFEILAVCHADDCHTHAISSSNVKVDLPFRGVTIIRF